MTGARSPSVEVSRMRSLFTLPLIGALALSIAACSNGSGGTSLPFNGPPNGTGGSSGTVQGGSTGVALMRYVQGSPDIGGTDICIDETSIGGSASTNIPYEGYNATPLAVPAGITHTVSIYRTLTPAEGGAGAECATAPGPYFGSPALGVTTIAPVANTRFYLVLGGRVGSTFGLFFYPGPGSFATAPASPQAQLFDASPSFGAAGFGFVSTTGTSATLVGSLNPPLPSSVTATVTTPNSYALATFAASPASVYVGRPATGAPVVPLATKPAPGAIAGNPYVVDLISVDATTGAGVDIVAIPEPTSGYGF